MKTILKKLSLMIAVLIFLCSCVENWVNPISDVQNAKVDKRLIGTWVPKDKEVIREIPISMYHMYEIDEHSMYVYMVPPMDSMDPNTACVGGYFKMHVSELGGRTFVNLRPYDCSTKKFLSYYLIFEYEFNGENEMSFYPADAKFVMEAIENKRLSGYKKKEGDTFYGENIVVTATSLEIREFIKNSPKEKLFYKDTDIKVKRFERPTDTKKSICILF